MDNTFTLINATEQFWDVLERNGHRRSLTSAYLLYGYLCHHWNGCGRPASFKVQNNLVCACIGLSGPSLIRQRQILKNAGLIDFKTRGKGDTNITYEILKCYQRSKNILLLPDENEKNFTSPVTSPVTSHDDIKQSKSNSKELIVVVDGEVKNFNYLLELLSQDIALKEQWVRNGNAAADFSEGLREWMIQNHESKYQDFGAMRKHLLFWIPNFSRKKYQDSGRTSHQRPVAAVKTTGHSSYAEGF